MRMVQYKNVKQNKKQSSYANIYDFLMTIFIISTNVSFRS